MDQQRDDWQPDIIRRDEVIYVPDLVRDLPEGVPPLVRETVFQNCELRGPAVVWLGRSSQVRGARWRETLESICIEVARPDGEIQGVIGFEACLFENCRFSRIGYLGTNGQIEAFKAAVLPAD